MIIIGKILRKLRHQRGYKQWDVAEKLSISITAYSKFETGATDITLSRLQQIAKIYDLTLAQLLTDGKEEKGPDRGELLKAKQLLEEREKQVNVLQIKLIHLFEEVRALNRTKK